MRVVKYLSIGLVVCLALVLIPWLLKFSDVRGLSSSPDDWATFGSYVGGTFSSLVSALALVALLYTILQQHHQIRVLQNRAIIEDILKSIDRIERDLDGFLGSKIVNVSNSAGAGSVLIRDILFKPSAMRYISLCPSEEEVRACEIHSHVHSEQLEKINLYEAINLAAGELNQIRIYTEALKKIEMKAETYVLSRYYYRKYRHACGSLYEHGFLKDKWEDKDF